MIIVPHRFLVYKTWFWTTAFSLIMGMLLWVGWVLVPVTTITGDKIEDPDMTGLMMHPAFSFKDQKTGDRLMIKAQQACHKDTTHYSLALPQCHWQGKHGSITLTGQCGYWNHHMKNGSLWHNVVMDYHHKGRMTTQQVHWDSRQRVWGHHPVQGHYGAFHFQSEGFVLLTDKLTLKGPARIQWAS